MRDKFAVVMLYHEMERKGCKYGFEALELVKQRYPQLKVTLFGTPELPTDLPEWYEYYQRPDREMHNRIYNEAAIFLGTSNIEVAADGTIAAAQPDKYMEITLKETADGGFNLISITSLTQGEHQ